MVKTKLAWQVARHAHKYIARQSSSMKKRKKKMMNETRQSIFYVNRVRESTRNDSIITKLSLR